MHQIGVGVLGPVFRTYDPAADRLVAVKAFHLDLTPEQAAGFVKALTGIVNVGLSHPAIIAPIAAGIEDGVPYLAQEYVAAESLGVALRHYAPAPAERALPFIIQVGEAIDAAHELGVTHGALHLRDIFVTPEEARTTGFGIVHALETVGLRGPIRRPYAAPELIAGRPWAGDADRFALASIAYELLTGKRAAGSGQQVTERLGTIPDVDDPEALREVFAIALGDAPESRFSSAAGLVVALRTAIGVEVDPGAFARQWPPDGASASVVSVAAGGEETISDLLANLDLHPVAEVTLSADPVAGDDQEARSDDAEVTLAADPAFDDAGRDPFPSEPVAVAAETDEYGTLEQPMLGVFDGDAAADGGDPYGLDDERDDLDDEDDLDVAPASPWSPRAMAPIALAIAVGTLAAYVVWLGIGSWGDETVTDELAAEAVVADAGDERTGSVPAAAAGSRDERGQEWSGATVAAAGADSVDVADTSRPTPLGVPPAQATAALPAEAVEAAWAARRRQAGSPAPPRTAPTETRGSGWLLVRTSPPGATVTIDGVNRGQTPLSLRDVPFGTHAVAISQTGFEERTREVNLSVDAAVVAVSVDLVPARAPGTTAAVQGATGSLFVDSRPPGARVLVDGRATGSTPVLLPDLAPGPHRVQIERDGYQIWTTTITVSGAERVRVAASLEAGASR
jgi:hypothetical protein